MQHLHCASAPATAASRAGPQAGRCPSGASRARSRAAVAADRTYGWAARPWSASPPRSPSRWPPAKASSRYDTSNTDSSSSSSPRGHCNCNANMKSAARSPFNLVGAELGRGFSGADAGARRVGARRRPRRLLPAPVRRLARLSEHASNTTGFIVTNFPVPCNVATDARSSAKYSSCYAQTRMCWPAARAPDFVAWCAIYSTQLYDEPGFLIFCTTRCLYDRTASALGATNPAGGHGYPRTITIVPYRSDLQH